MAPPPTKRRRIVLSMEKKREIIEKMNAGWTITRLSHTYDVPVNTLYDLRKNKAKMSSTRKTSARVPSTTCLVKS